MDQIKKLIAINEEKLKYLKEYLTANEMIEDMIRVENTSAIKELTDKKRALGASIDVIDEKLMDGLTHLKATCGVDDLSELKVADYPLLRDLKAVSGTVLKTMVDLKTSDNKQLQAIETLFTRLKGREALKDKNKMYYYANKLLND